MDFIFYFLKVLTTDTQREVGILHVVSYKVSYVLQGVYSLYYYTDATRNIVRNTILKQQKSVYKFQMINRSFQKCNVHTKHVPFQVEYNFFLRTTIQTRRRVISCHTYYTLYDCDRKIIFSACTRIFCGVYKILYWTYNLGMDTFNIILIL